MTTGITTGMKVSARRSARDGIAGAPRLPGAGPVLERETGPQRPVDAVGVQVPAAAAALAPHRAAQPPLQRVVVPPLRILADLDRGGLVSRQQVQAAQHVLD